MAITITKDGTALSVSDWQKENAGLAVADQPWFTPGANLTSYTAHAGTGLYDPGCGQDPGYNTPELVVGTLAKPAQAAHGGGQGSH